MQKLPFGLCADERTWFSCASFITSTNVSALPYPIINECVFAVLRSTVFLPPIFWQTSEVFFLHFFSPDLEKKERRIRNPRFCSKSVPFPLPLCKCYRFSPRNKGIFFSLLALWKPKKPSFFPTAPSFSSSPEWKIKLNFMESPTLTKQGKFPGF